MGRSSVQYLGLHVPYLKMLCMISFNVYHPQICCFVTIRVRGLMVGMFGKDLHVENMLLLIPSKHTEVTWIDPPVQHEPNGVPEG